MSGWLPKGRLIDPDQIGFRADLKVMTEAERLRFETALADAAIALECVVETYRTGWLNECYNDAVRAMRVAMHLASTAADIRLVTKQRSKLLNLQLAFGLPDTRGTFGEW